MVSFVIFTWNSMLRTFWNHEIVICWIISDLANNWIIIQNRTYLTSNRHASFNIGYNWPCQCGHVENNSFRDPCKEIIVSEIPAKKHEYQTKTVKMTFTTHLFNKRDYNCHCFDQNTDRNQKHLLSIPELWWPNRVQKVMMTVIKGMRLRHLSRKKCLKDQNSPSKKNWSKLSYETLMIFSITDPVLNNCLIILCNKCIVDVQCLEKRKIHSTPIIYHGFNW